MAEPTVLARYGLLLVFVNVLLGQAGVPVPAVPLLLACGALAGRGEISPALLRLTGTGQALRSVEESDAAGRCRLLRPARRTP